jgi:hypothetical protein
MVSTERFNVRPNAVGWPPPSNRSSALFVLALLTFVAACNREEKPAVDSAALAAAAAAAAVPPPKPVVMPEWPSDTPSVAIDRPLAIRPEMRAHFPRCSKETPVVAIDMAPIFPGQSLPDLLRACSKAYPVWHFDDGNYGPAVAVIMGKALLIVDLDGTTEEAQVKRVIAFDHAQTAEKIGAGTPVAKLQSAYGVPTWRKGQCSVDALFATKPGLVFRIALPEEGSDAVTCTDMRRLGYGDDFSHFPRGARVSSVAAELAP